MDRDGERGGVDPEHVARSQKRDQDTGEGRDDEETKALHHLVERIDPLQADVRHTCKIRHKTLLRGRTRSIEE
jgi:hypothetical protein